MAESEGDAYKHIQAHVEHQSRQKMKAEDDPSTYRCGFCLTLGFGPRYLCGACNLNIHRYCGSQLKGQMPCFLHPKLDHSMSLQVVQQGARQCSVCSEHIFGYHYSCDADEDVRVHPICFQLRHASATTAAFVGQSRTHFAHGDDLKEVYIPKRYACDGCGTPGWGLRLRCGECDFNLHPHCFSCPTEQPCFLGHKEHVSRLMVADSPSRKRQCHLCDGTIAHTETTVGMHYLCETCGALAHPLCVQLLQQEKATASAPTDGNARLLKAARRVAGRVIAHTIEMKLIGGIFATGSYFSEQYQACGDVSEAASSTVHHLAHQVSHMADVAVDAPVDLLENVADAGGSLVDKLASALEFFSNLL